MAAKLTFLGTGTSQGVPMIGCHCDVCMSTDQRDKRLRSSVLVEYEGLTILVDAGPDFRQQMLAAEVSHLDAILLTHNHFDHNGGLYHFPDSQVYMHPADDGLWQSMMKMSPDGSYNGLRSFYIKFPRPLFLGDFFFLYFFEN